MTEGINDRGDETKAKSPPQMPVITFATFIASLNAAVLAQLGIIEEPGSGKRVKDLFIAKQTIDVIAMLEEKTRGNLTHEEAAMIKSILYDLRMIYVREKG